MELLVSCLVLPTSGSWEKLLRDFARQWKNYPLIHLHLRGSGPDLELCLEALSDLTNGYQSIRISVDDSHYTYQTALHQGNSRIDRVHAVVWLERTDG